MKKTKTLTKPKSRPKGKSKKPKNINNHKKAVVIPPPITEKPQNNKLILMIFKNHFKVITNMVKAITLTNVIRIVILIFSYKLIENEIENEALTMINLTINGSKYTVPLLVFLISPALLSMGITEIIIYYFKTKWRAFFYCAKQLAFSK